MYAFPAGSVVLLHKYPRPIKYKMVRHSWRAHNRVTEQEKKSRKRKSHKTQNTEQPKILATSGHQVVVVVDLEHSAEPSTTVVVVSTV